MKKAVKINLILIVIMIVSGCDSVAVFDKMNKLGLNGYLVNVTWDIQEQSAVGDLKTLQLHEYHDLSDGNGNAEIVHDLDSMSITSTGSSGSDSFWGFIPGPEDQSGGLPVYMLFHTVEILLNQDTLYSGTGNYAGSSNGEPYTISYSSAYVPSYSFPKSPVMVNGEMTDSYAAEMLVDPGQLIRIDFIIDSVNPYFSGEATMLLSSGAPNGMIYLIYDHSTDYTTVVSQNNGGGSSGEFFSTPYFAGYDWWIIRDSAEF